MIAEVRTYRFKPGLRERFLELFATRTAPLQQAKGMLILGPFVDLEDVDVFYWVRAFPSLEAREEMKSALYDGEEWKGELEAIAMPMLENYSMALTTMPPDFINDLPTARG